MNPSEIFSDWNQHDGELLHTSVSDIEYDQVNVKEAASQAQKQLHIRAHDKDAFVVPLFSITDSRPTNEYVYYRPKTNQIGWYDTGFGISGVERFTDCENLESNEIGHRLRFWLPSAGHDLDLDVDESKLPPNRIEPIDQLSNAEMKEFFSQLRSFVQSERKAEQESNWETYTDLGIEEAIRLKKVSGPFIPVSTYSNSTGETIYSFQMPTDEEGDSRAIDFRDDEGLFQGNYCILDTKGGEDHFPIKVELTSVDDPTIKLKPRWQESDDRLAIEKFLATDESEIWLHHLLNPVPFDRRVKAIRQVQQNKRKRALLTGQRSIEFSVNKYDLPESEVELNDYQTMALIWAEAAEDVVCIHGPPGTGKTRTLTAYIQEAVSRGQSVLVAAHSNQAVDNLLVGDSTIDTPEEDTLHAIAQNPDMDISIARVGNNSRNRVVREYYAGSSVGRADVVASTTSGAAKFDPDKFDVAVVDEATQASRPATAIALNCSQRLVLAGDHKQLPPYYANETMEQEELHISLFEYLLDRYDDEIAVLLKRQYRMNAEIAEFPNNAFYDGELETAGQNHDWAIDDLKPIIGIDISGTERQQNHGKSYYNPEEAEAVAKQIKLLVLNGVEPDDIGVISAYSGQISEIRRHIQRLEIDDISQVTVDTVDSFQGGEREAIIVSFVRSNEGGHSGFLEFPDEGPRRLNVAVTRARKRIVLVGDWSTLATRSPHRSPEESCARLYAKLEEYLQTRDRMLTVRPD